MELIVDNIHPFNLEIVAEGGQAFRWDRQQDGSYIGVADRYVMRVYQQDNALKLTANSCPGDKSFDTFIRNYFDLERNYSSIEERLCRYEELIPAVKYCSGNRILQQDPWETTVTFITSANNSIANIKKTIARICEFYGEPLAYEGGIYYTFPSPEVLAGVTEEELRKTRCGFRAKYIAQTAKMVAGGEVDLFGLHRFSVQEAREQLMRLPGVGRKVADCILLFSMRKYDAFPIDVWIKRVLEHLYFNGREMPLRRLQEFAERRFGELAGFAQQYLFHYTRTFWGNEKIF